MIPRARANYSLDDLADAARVRESSGDDHIEAFEAQLRAFLGVEHVLLTASGRSGLHSILKAIDRPRVIVPAYTCNAVIEAAKLAGKTIDYVEVEPDGFNVSVEHLIPLLGRDAVFIATHQFGIPCAIEAIVRLCRDRNTLVVEDAAASLGTRVSGALTGTFGDAAFFSFDTSKLITVPLKGGAVTAKEKTLFARIRAVHAAEISPMPGHVKARTLALSSALVLLQGPKRYRLFHELRFERRGKFTAEAPLGPVTRTAWYRYGFTNWQALIAARQMERIDAIIERRRAIYAAYEARLRPTRAFRTPPPDTRREWAPIRFPIRVLGDKLAFYRRAAKRGVDCAFSFTFIEAPERFERAHDLARSVLDLPFYSDLTDAELDATVTTLSALDDSPPAGGQVDREANAGLQ